jgi:hypothetical protein
MTTSNASPDLKTQLQKFEALLDVELARRPTYGFAANEALILACNATEMAAHDLIGGLSSMLNDGIETLTSHLVSGRPGAEPDVKQLCDDLVFAAHYHHVRDLLYYSYNAPDSVNWIFSPGRIEIRYRDRSLPRQFFTTFNEWYFLSVKAFEGFDAPNEIRGLIKGLSEFELGNTHERLSVLLEEHADRLLASSFCILSPDAVIELGGYSYRDFHTIYRVMMMKALYHRYQAEVNEAVGCILTPADEPWTCSQKRLA